MAAVDLCRVWLVIRIPLRVFWIILENAVGLLFYVSALILFRPLLYISPQLYWRIDEHLVWLGMHYVSYWMHSAVGKVMIYGDCLEDFTDEPCLVVVNHQSDADPLMLLVAFRRLESLYGRLSVVLEDIFHCTHFGIMMRLRGDFFVHQGREQRHLQSALIEEHMIRYERVRDPRWCVLFPEGGFLKKRKARNAEYARKNGYPLLNHVLLPRLGMLQALTNVQTNREHKNHVVVTNGHTFHNSKPKAYFRRMIDVTIAYPQATPITLSEMLYALSPISHVAIHFRVRNIDHLAGRDEEELRSFIYQAWIEKDKLLQSYYDTGSFPDLRVEDPLSIDYFCYLRSYCVGLPALKLYAVFFSACFRYAVCLCVWVLQKLMGVCY